MVGHLFFYIIVRKGCTNEDQTRMEMKNEKPTPKDLVTFSHFTIIPSYNLYLSKENGNIYRNKHHGIADAARLVAQDSNWTSRFHDVERIGAAGCRRVQNS